MNQGNFDVMNETETTRAELHSDLNYLNNFGIDNSEMIQKFKIVGLNSTDPRSSMLLTSFETCLQIIHFTSGNILNSINNLNFDDSTVFYCAINLNSHVEILKSLFKIVSPNFKDLKRAAPLLEAICQMLEKLVADQNLYSSNY